MPTLGQELRAERERKAVSLRDIADQTKISLRILQAIESDRWEDTPGSFFIKGIVKAYVRSIGAEEKFFLDLFHVQAGTKPAEAVCGPDDFAFSDDRPGPGRRRVLAGLAIALAAALTLTAAYYLLLRPRPERTPLPVPATAVPSAKSQPADPVAFHEEPSVEAPSGLRLEFRFHQDTWMKVAADGINVLDGIQPSGSSVRLEAEREFILQTGNAGGFEFDLNGRPARSLGRSGAVRTDVRINTDTLASFWIEEAPPDTDDGER